MTNTADLQVWSKNEVILTNSSVSAAHLLFNSYNPLFD